MIVETLTFKDKGGWLCDDGYLLAHGLGRPVEDAITTITVSDKCQSLTSTFNLRIKTRDWVSPYGAGMFEVMVNSKAYGPFGKGNGEWHWEDAGEVELKRGKNEIRLHDLTGFEGRCAAIELVWVRDGGAQCREECIESRTGSAVGLELVAELVVVGGGYAGMCAAVAAARRGVKTVLVQDRPVWGGNASSEVRVGPIGGLGLGPFPKNSDLAYELLELTHVEGKSTSGGLRPKIDDAMLDAWLAAEVNLTTFKCCKIEGVKLNGKSEISSVIGKVWRSGEEIEIHGKQFVDATGDAVLARLAGAEVRTVPEEDESLKGGYGSTNFWTTRWTDHEVKFPSCPWALQINETNWQVNRPKFFVEGDYPYVAGWNWESGFDKDAVLDAEAIRDLNFRAAYGMWDYLKNKAPDRAKYTKAEMDWMAHVLGKRAAVRIVGDYVLNERDLVEHREYDDGVVVTTWFLDLHAPHPMNERAFPGESFRSIAYDDPKYHELVPNGTGRQIKIEPYAIPYRCFYSKDIANLWMAGKDISCTHVAMSSVRVENTTAQMGTMVGRAAVVCLQKGYTPRELGAEHFDDLKVALCAGSLSKLAKEGKRRYQGRNTLKGEIKYWLRPIVRPIKRILGLVK